MTWPKQKNGKPLGHLPVSTWRIAAPIARCDICCSFIDEGFPYLEDDWAEECQNFCIPCAIKYDKNLKNNEEVKA